MPVQIFQFAVETISAKCNKHKNVVVHAIKIVAKTYLVDMSAENILLKD